jgi:hypothetical protein
MEKVISRDNGSVVTIERKLTAGINRRGIGHGGTLFSLPGRHRDPTSKKLNNSARKSGSLGARMRWRKNKVRVHAPRNR